MNKNLIGWEWWFVNSTYVQDSQYTQYKHHSVHIMIVVYHLGLGQGSINSPSKYIFTNWEVKQNLCRSFKIKNLSLQMLLYFAPYKILSSYIKTFTNVENVVMLLLLCKLHIVPIFLLFSPNFVPIGQRNAALSWNIHK